MRAITSAVRTARKRHDDRDRFRRRPGLGRHAGGCGSHQNAANGGGDGANPLHGTLRLGGTFSGLMPAVCAIAVHLRVSSAMKLPKSCGEPGAGSAPTLPRLSRTDCDFKPSLIAALSLPTMSGGVPAGTTTPVQNVVT